ncbi:Imidazolonepropionase [Mycena venus]|uniref:Imidazolonepropionase n=1 Tax=Mycena venus TaxID=2733690 RepID=A0A8H6YIB4_9AGAR|nr:Imidazolonepropionase [Mycena venus]
MLNTLTFIAFLLLALPGHSCPHVEHSRSFPSYNDALEIARSNNERRVTRQVSAPAKTAITNVRVFDGEKLLPLSTVFIEGGVIVPYASEATVVDGNGGVLLSGLIDAHSHPVSVEHLENFASYGVTTAMVMGCYPYDICHSLQNHPGLTDIRFAGQGAVAPNSTHALLGAGVPLNETITSPSQAPDFIARQLEAGATFIKMIAEDVGSPTLSQETMNALVVAAHAKGVRVACHAADYSAVDRALTAQTDQSHHVPNDFPLNSSLISRFVAQNTISVPTLSIFLQFDIGGRPDGAHGFDVATASAGALNAAKVPILAGTDANNVPGPFSLAFGSSLHTELELLVQAGLSTVEALRSATVLAAQHNLLFDRGVVASGMRADLLLISGDPIANISATRDIQRVWIGGVEYTTVSGN